MELPGDGWAGWSFQGGVLVTPEGRQIAPKDSAWWSLMVRNARSFVTQYHETNRLRSLLADLNAAAQTDLGSGEAAPETGGNAAGLVSYKTNRKTSPELDKYGGNRHQNDVIIESWPTLYDFQTPLTQPHVPKPTTSESPSTPSFALPWMPTCTVQFRYQRPNPAPHLASCVNLNQRLGAHLQSQPPSSPEPKSKPSTSKTNGTSREPSQAVKVSARPTAAKAAKLASASRGQK